MTPLQRELLGFVSEGSEKLLSEYCTPGTDLRSSESMDTKNRAVPTNYKRATPQYSNRVQGLKIYTAQAYTRLRPSDFLRVLKLKESE